MLIQLDPKQIEYLRRQAEATEKIAVELAKLRKLMQDRLDFERGRVEAPADED